MVTTILDITDRRRVEEDLGGGAAVGVQLVVAAPRGFDLERNGREGGRDGGRSQDDGEAGNVRHFHFQFLL